MKVLPAILIWLRLLIGLFIIPLSVMAISNYNVIAILLLSIGLLSDIFDGIIARKYNVSTVKLRSLDSTIDQVFFLCFAVATYIQCPGFFKLNAVQLFLLLGLEALTYLVSFIKFRREIALHSIGAKIWTLFIFMTLIEIILTCHSVILFQLCFWIGIITRLEIIAIIFTLRKWTNDVPSIVHAFKIRQGKSIKRHKLFNG